MKAPKTYIMWLGPNHWAWKLSDDEFEHYAGVHVERRVLRSIPR